MEAALSTRAAADGRWLVEVPTPPAGGPFELAIRGEQTLVFEDVWVGEVWIASGQSNMEWSLSKSDGAAEAIAAASHPRIRFFDVEQTVSMAPADDCKGRWLACAPGAIDDFSAVAYYFGRELLENLDVPIGLVGANWGGTPAKAWTSAQTLHRRGDFDQELARIEDALSHPEREPSLDARRQSWWTNHQQAEVGMRGGWMAPQLDDQNWELATLPGTWSELGLGSFDGCVWYRRALDLPAEWAGRELLLELGPVDDMDLTWFNGQLIGESRGDGHWDTPREYVVPAGLVRGARGVISVCAIDTGGVGRLGSESGSMRLRPTNADESESLDLAGEWAYRAGSPLTELGRWPRDSWFDSRYPTALFNGMIAPLVPYAIGGVIWYQGEADVAANEVYRTLFQDLIRDWRAHWGRGDFPFLFVQLAPFAYRDDKGEAALLREAQTMALATPNTGMAVTMDIGDPADIHPRNKRDVGKRLALWALAKTYGRAELAFSGPLYRSMQVEGAYVRVEFDHGSGLHGLDLQGSGPISGATPLSHFTIAGEDRVFHSAVARIEGESVIVACDAVPAPVAVRYAWGAADTPNLRNGAGLPAPSFRTDDW